MILTDIVELTKGKHTYKYQPQPTPTFEVDAQPITIDFAEGIYAYFICSCPDYQERENKFAEGLTYKNQQDSELYWDDVATCCHISLLRRYFAQPFLEKVVQAIQKKEKNPQRVAGIFLQSEEARFFVNKSSLTCAKLLDKTKEQKKKK